MKMNKRISLITFIVATIISITSAYCTVMGFANIFISAPITAMVIASVIELGRVVLIYDVHHYWHIMPFIKKLPGVLMLLIAMSLSAIGVFGFFANAHSASSRDALPMQLEIGQLESLIETTKSEIDMNNVQIKQLQESMTSGSMDEAMKKFVEMKYVSKAMNLHTELQGQINSLTESNRELNKKINDSQVRIVELQKEAEIKAPTIAHLKYFSKLFNIDNDTSIIVFIVMIMLVFDTMAMYLMITSDWAGSLDKPIVIEEKPEIISNEIKPNVEEKKMINDINIGYNIKPYEYKYEPLTYTVDYCIPNNEEKDMPIQDVIEQTEQIIEKTEKIIDNYEEKNIDITENSANINTINDEPSVEKKVSKKKENNIDIKVKKLVELIQKDNNIIDTVSFIDSISKTPLIVNKLGESLGEDSEIMIKLRSKIK